MSDQIDNPYLSCINDLVRAFSLMKKKIPKLSYINELFEIFQIFLMCALLTFNGTCMMHSFTKPKS